MQAVNDQGQPLYMMDRSRIEVAGTCPRKYYWSSAFLGLGIQPLRGRPAWELLTGSWTHEGLESVLRGVDPLKAAVHAGGAYLDSMRQYIEGLEIGPARDMAERDLVQQVDLVRALVYGWALVGLPRYNERYELVDIEREEQLGFALTSDSGTVEMRLLTRADLISRLRGAASIYVIHNFKTVSNPNLQWQRQWSMDQQTLTERITTEARLGCEVTGVVIEGLCKGSKKEYPIGSGFYQHNSPLIWAWADKEDGSRLPNEQRGFYAQYEWTCNEPHVMGNGRKCAGGKQHRLSNCTKVRVAEHYPGGLFAWIDYLNANDRPLLEQQFISLPPIGRSAYEVERWKRQVLPAEYSRQVNAQLVNNVFMDGDKQGAYELLDHYFPMVTGHGNCIRPFSCSYLDICWGADDPMDADKYGPRVPNHPAESQLIQIEVAKSA